MANKSGIHIKPSKRGTFTAAAKRRGMGVQEFARKVLSNKGNYSSAMVKKANFARNATKWDRQLGGNLINTMNTFQPQINSAFDYSKQNSSSGIGQIPGIGMFLNAGMQLGQYAGDAWARSNESNMSDMIRNAQSDLTEINVDDYMKNSWQSAMKKGITSGTGILGLGKALLGQIGKRKEIEEMNTQIAEARDAKNAAVRIASMAPQQSYMPVAQMGGFIAYDGESHSGPNGGIPVDSKGNPISITKNEPVALTEDKEVAWLTPEGESYIFSENLGYAKLAKSLMKRYRLGKDNQHRDKMLEEAITKQFENLKDTQELERTMKGLNDPNPMAKYGGSLSASKAKKILKDGKVHGKALTDKQKRFFGWIAGGKKQDGGPLDPVFKLNEMMEKGFSPADTATFDRFIDPAVNYGGLNIVFQGLPKTQRPEFLDLYNQKYSPRQGIQYQPFTFNADTSDIIIKPSYLHDQPLTERFLKKKRKGGNLPKYQNGIEEFGFMDVTPWQPNMKPWVSMFPELYRPDFSMVDNRNVPTVSINRLNQGIQDPAAPLGNNRTPSYMQNLWGVSPSQLEAANYTDPNMGQSRWARKFGHAPYSTWQKMVRDNPAGFTMRDYNTGQQVPLDQEGIRLATDKMTGEVHEGMEFAPLQRKSGIINNPIDTSKLATTRVQPVGSPDVYNNPTGASYNPNLSPMGHILSGVGSLADYAAFKRYKPTEISLPRVGPERVSYARQRLSNRENAATARIMNARNARNMGLNAAQAMSNIGASNLDVNRLLGQQNAESLERQENTNAMLRMQANMANMEAGVQESLYNNQLNNAYRARLAMMNPLGNLSRTAASYFADNAAYRRGFDTMKMLAPNVEIYRDPKYTNAGYAWRSLLGITSPQIRFTGKTF